MKTSRKLVCAALGTLLVTIFALAATATPITLTNGTLSVSGGQLFATNELARPSPRRLVR